MTDEIQFRDANMRDAQPVLSVRGLALPAGDRGEELLLRVTAPLVGKGLPVVLFSHGYGSSMDAYAPLTDYWASRGFVVIQPTHLDARRLALSADDPRRPDIWRIRVADMVRVLDALLSIVGELSWLNGRVDTSAVAAAGHSFGGQTVSMLPGGRMQGSMSGEDWRDERIRAGVLLASGGHGGTDLSDFAGRHTPWLDMTFEHLVTPTLVVVGDADRSPLTVRGPDWFADPYRLSPGGRVLLTLEDGEHMLGGISGYAVTETTDESPERVACVQSATAAFLDAMLKSGDLRQPDLATSFRRAVEGQGTIERK
jgi:pimeloyl-ACP methyl ester carboxylesterase